MPRNSIILVVALAVVATGAFVTRDRWMPRPKAADPHAHGDDHAEHDHGGDRIKLSPQARANLKLEVAPLVAESYTRKLLIPGVVVDRPGVTDRGVTARMAGVVTDIKARPGDTVRAGEPLFTLQLVGEFVQGTQSELAKAARELTIAEASRDRTSGFVQQGTKASSDLVEAENQVKRVATQVQAYRRQLQALGLTPAQVGQAEKGEIVSTMEIVTPERQGDGTGVSTAEPVVYEVQELKVQLGEAVTAGQALMTLSNHQALFVEGRAFKSEAKALAQAAKESWDVAAEFAEESPGQWGKVGPLTIRHLANSVDPVSRTFAFYLPLRNESETYTKEGKTFFVWRFRPGQRVRLWVPVERIADDVFVLPPGAVVREGPEAFVFRQSGDQFERKPVTVLHETRTEVVIKNDGSVGPGQFVVRNQAAALNRAIKAAAGGGGGAHEGHDHPH